MPLPRRIDEGGTGAPILDILSALAEVGEVYNWSRNNSGTAARPFFKSAPSAAGDGLRPKPSMVLPSGRPLGRTMLAVVDKQAARTSGGEETRKEIHGEFRV